MARTRVLIVDDSTTIRKLIRARISEDPRLEVVGEAADPYQAREMIKTLSPDVLTLDVEMPRMNGLEFLEKLMRLRPMPVVMISTETHKGSSAALEALSLGAVECVGKPAADKLPSGFVNLPEILLMAAGARVRTQNDRQVTKPASGFNWNGRCVFIGSSTGGVDALETVLAEYPADCPPTLITQHMPAGFLASFAHRLDARIAPKIELARHGAPLEQGHVYLAPGGDHHLAVNCGTVPTCRLFEGEKRSGHRPSVDVLMESAVGIAARSVAVMLTGMGRDGAEGMLQMRRAGARCIAQDEASSVVFGMPKAAFENGGAEKLVPLGRIAKEILAMTGKPGIAQPQRIQA
ncbi:protein-glutamate methylesterase/protein-glutamine glutaminase [Phaeovulum sp. W22_SRMD_FR3]|uniref:protein-glutamate methylesterase/protein-glutamine glutaminase n=1 Tax=Phaeovulum sp. W22_SRMD_FR3 TaxID=3240274 RepID=UPI003F9B413D